ncbi:MAG: hypothetical protein ACLQBC_04420 [Syntrophales bacterium]|jgi:hypothetical protein
MTKNITLKIGEKISRKELVKRGWTLFMTLPNGNEVLSRDYIKIMWDPKKEEVVHLFTAADTYRRF